MRSQIRSQTRETVSTAILEAAEDLIAAKGLSGAPLLQIAKRAGVAVGTLYNYFEDRDDLIRALFEMRRATLRPQVRAVMAKGGELPFEQRLHAFVRDLFEVYETHRKFIKVAIETEHLKLTPSTQAQDVQTAIAELVKAGVKEKVVAPTRADMLPLVVAGALRAVVLERIRQNRKLEEVDADALVAIFLEGARK